MIRAALHAVLLLYTLSVSAIWSQSVACVAGNVVYYSRGGMTRQLTSSGSDYDPSLSIDGRHVVFVREIRRHPDASGLGELIEESHLYVVDIDLKQPPRAILARAATQSSRSFGWFTEPQFSPTNNSVYFLVPNWAAVTGGLFRLNLASGNTSFVSAAQKFWVVPFGVYSGKIIVWQNPMFVGGGRYDVFNMLEPSGELNGVVGFTEEAVKRFLQEVDDDESYSKSGMQRR